MSCSGPESSTDSSPCAQPAPRAWPWSWRGSNQGFANSRFRECAIERHAFFQIAHSRNRDIAKSISRGGESVTGFYLGVLGVAVALSALLVYLNEVHHLFRTDVFPNAAAKWLAYTWMTLLLVIMSFLVAYASTHATPDLANVTFWSLFNFHIVLVIFLFGWWLLTGMPSLRRFLNLDT